MSGWIKIHRSITDHWLYSEKRVFSKLEAWYDLLLNVNYIDSKTMIKGKLYEVKRGQSIMSLESWGKRWNWDKSKVRRFLNLLQNDSMIELVSDNITTQLTICNYDSYQAERNADETQVKHKRNTNEIQTKPIKESKEVKNIFIVPNFNDILEYCMQNDLDLDVHKFLNFYESKGWMVGKNKMKDWKAAVRNWAKPKESIKFEEPRELQILRQYAKKQG
jgi:hypothetical protein